MEAGGGDEDVENPTNPGLGPSYILLSRETDLTHVSSPRNTIQQCAFLL